MPRRPARLAPAIAILALALVPPLAAQAPTHAYRLNGTLTDALGGPSLVALGGTVGSSAYAFGAGQGLSLTNGIAASVYSLELAFSLDDVGGYRKVVDFKNRLRDEGAYVQNGFFTFYGAPASNAALVFQPGVLAHLVLTRAADQRFTAYVNGAQVLSFLDAGLHAVFSEPGAKANLLMDDARTAREQSGGSLDWLRVYDRALTGSEVAARFAAGDDALLGAAPPVTTTPEPATAALLAAGAGALGLVARRRRIPV
jgi:hypothetical protein